MGALTIIYVLAAIGTGEASTTFSPTQAWNRPARAFFGSVEAGVSIPTPAIASTRESAARLTMGRGFGERPLAYAHPSHQLETGSEAGPRVLAGIAAGTAGGLVGIVLGLLVAGTLELVPITVPPAYALGAGLGVASVNKAFFDGPPGTGWSAILGGMLGGVLSWSMLLISWSPMTLFLLAVLPVAGAIWAVEYHRNRVRPVTGPYRGGTVGTAAQGGGPRPDMLPL